MQTERPTPRAACLIAQLNTDIPNATEPRTIYSEAEKAERRALGLPPCEPAASGQLQAANSLNHSPIRKRAICAPGVLNEASAYGSAFSRGLRVDLPGGITHLLLSGASTGIQARICRSDLLVEIEAMAILYQGTDS